MDITQIRTYGNLPEKLSDNFILSHLDNIVEELRYKLEKYDEIKNNPNHTHYKFLSEATICLTLATLLPLSNNFFIEGIPKIETETNVRFYSPDEIDNLVNIYEKRANTLINRIKGKVKFGSFTMSIIGGRK